MSLLIPPRFAQKQSDRIIAKAKEEAQGLGFATLPVAARALGAEPLLRELAAAVQKRRA